MLILLKCDAQIMYLIVQLEDKTLHTQLYIGQKKSFASYHLAT